MSTTENYVNKGRDILSAKVLQWVLERERETEGDRDRQTDRLWILNTDLAHQCFLVRNPTLLI